MKLRIFQAYFLLVGLSISASSQTIIPGGTVSGTWALSHSPFLINGDITIPDDSTLNIQAGVQVEFQGHYSLTVLGRLLAIGTEEDSIRFTINDTTGFSNQTSSAGGWYGIRFTDTPVENDSSKIIYCLLEYGKAYGDVWHLNAGGAICIIQYGKVLISNCMIRNNVAISSSGDPSIGGGLYLYRSDVILRDNTFESNRAQSGGAVFMDDSDPVFENNLLEMNEAEYGGGLAMGGASHPSFSGDRFSNNTAVINGGGIMFYEPSSIQCHGLNLIGNSAVWGGGIGAAGGTLLASECYFSGNQASLWGGGIAGDFATLTINTSTFEQNSSQWGSGGLHLDHAVGTIQQCDFEGNSAVFGGAIHALFSQVSSVQNTFSNNLGDAGAGMHLENSDCTVDLCQFDGNQAVNGSGGAIDFTADTSIFGRNLEFSLNRSILMENSASANSGAVRIEQAHADSSMVDLLVDSCQFIRNRADIFASLRIGNRIEGFLLSNSIFNGNTARRWVAGPGIVTQSKGKVINCVFYCNYAAYSDTTRNAHGVSLGSQAEVDIINCTLTDTSSAGGIGISVHRGVIASVSNSIIWGCGYRPISIVTQAELACTVHVNYCTLENGRDSVYVSDSLSVLNWGVGNLDLDPLFVDLAGADLHLQDASPCIGSGSNGFMLGQKEISAPISDLEGIPRPSPQGSDADLGAFEHALGSPMGTAYPFPGLAAKDNPCWNYPNPFRGSTTFSYAVSRSSFVHLVIYNLQGQAVETVVAEFQPAGHYLVPWDGSALAPGVYLFILEGGGELPQSGKLLILK